MSLSLWRQRLSVVSEIPRISHASAGVTIRWQPGLLSKSAEKLREATCVQSVVQLSDR
jgi:hypothetical protein